MLPKLAFYCLKIKERQCNVAAVSIVLGIQKCILIILPLFSMCRQAILLNVLKLSLDISLVSWPYFEVSACSLAFFFHLGVSEGDLTLLLMC